MLNKTLKEGLGRSSTTIVAVKDVESPLHIVQHQPSTKAVHQRFFGEFAESIKLNIIKTNKTLN